MSIRNSRAVGFFEALALRFARGIEANKIAGRWPLSLANPSPGLVLGAAEKQLEEWIDESVEDGPHAKTWALIARTELAAARKAARELKAMAGAEAIEGLEAFVLSEGIGYRHGMERIVSEMFGFKAAPQSWQKPGEYEADARAYSGLDSVDGALGDVALTALNAKLARRYCELRLGRWPAIELPRVGDREGATRDIHEFGGALESWAPQGAAGREPTLAYLEKAFGPEAKSAAGRFWWGAEALDFGSRVAALSSEWGKPGLAADRDIPMREGAPRAASNMRARWSGLAKQERAKTMSLIVELAGSKPGIAEAARAALMGHRDPVSSWDAPETAALMFGFGWSEPKLGEPGQPDASGLREHGAGLQKTANDAVRAKTVGRLCEMALGRWPRGWSALAASNGVVEMRFASFDRPWVEEAYVDGRLVEEPLRPREPSLGMMCRVCGAAAIEAMAGLAWGGAAKDRFAARWMDSSHRSPLNQWRFPIGAVREGGPMAEAAVAVGVPEYALGLKPVPPGRWVQAGLRELLGRCPDQVWGGFEAWRPLWVAEAKALREEISQARLNASYSDDPSCRRSESEQCNRWEYALDAREALLDALVRSRLPAGDPYKFDGEQLKAAAAAIARCEGDWKEAEFEARSGGPIASVFEKMSMELGVGDDWPSNAKQLARMLPSILEARAIEEGMPGAGGQRAAQAKSKRL